MKSGGAKQLRHRNKKLYGQLIDDVSTLAKHSIDEESWQVLLPLFLKKWSEDVPKKVKNKAVKEALETTVGYFRENWAEKDHCRRWYAGSNPLGPTTNNALETNNRILKSPGFSDHQSLGAEELFQVVSVPFSRLIHNLSI